MNEVRIIGGKWKRRKLRFPQRPHLRPSPARVRETLFHWLAGAIDAARCLDLYAGAGALGFEALSRGAGHVTFVESDPIAVRSLQVNRLRFATQRCRIVRARVLPWLRRAHDAWDILFLDPPYDSGELPRAIDLLARRQLVHGESLVYLECAKGHAPPLPGWRLLNVTRAGDTEGRLIQPVV